MDVAKWLDEYRTDILSEANETLRNAHLKQYQNVGVEECKSRLTALYDLTIQSIRDEYILEMTNYIQKVANERYMAGFDIDEVQMAFIILEETVWNHMVENILSSQIAEALRRVSTVLGAGKYMLASTYVSLASKMKAPSYDIPALFKGLGNV